MSSLLDPQNNQDIQRIVDKILNLGYEELNVTSIEPYASQYAIERQHLTRLLKNESNDEEGKARRRWLLMLASSPTVTVLVGYRKKPYYLNRDILQHYSLHFRSLLTDDGTPVGDTTPEFRLLEVDEIAFDTFTQWLHFGHGSGTGSTRANNDPLAAPRLFHCYTLGDKLQASSFKAYILGKVHDYFRENPAMPVTLDQIRSIYGDTSEKEDPLRRFSMQRMCMQTSTDETWAEQAFFELMGKAGPMMDDYLKARERLEAYEGEGKDASLFMFE